MPASARSAASAAPGRARDTRDKHPTTVVRNPGSWHRAADRQSPTTSSPFDHPAHARPPRKSDTVREQPPRQPGVATALTRSSNVTHWVLPSRQLWPLPSSTTVVWLGSATETLTASHEIGSPTAVIAEAS